MDDLAAFKRGVRSIRRYASNRRRGIELFLNLTYECPLRCDYCYVDYARSATWSVEKIDYLFEHLLSVPGLVSLVTLFGGEPGLRMDLIRHVLTRRRELGLASLHFGIITSLSAHAKEMIELIEISPDLEIVVSMDGPGETKRKTKHGSSFIPVVEVSSNPRKPTYQYLAKHRNNVLIHKVVSGDEHHRSGFEWLQRLYDEHGIVFSYALDKTPTVVDRDSLTDAVYQHLQWCLRSDYVPIQTQSFIADWMAAQRGEYKAGCGINSEFFMDGSGVIDPCSISHAESSTVGFAITDEMGRMTDAQENSTRLELAIHNNPTCQSCPARGLCNGGCLVARYKLNKSYDVPVLGHCEMMLSVYDGISRFMSDLTPAQLDTITSDASLFRMKMVEFCNATDRECRSITNIINTITTKSRK